MNIRKDFSKDLQRSTMLKDLVYYEITSDIESAIAREKQLKKWERKSKINLIEKDNPEWIDLYYDL